ncbi:hypothetical protein HMPREF3156_00321 [Neisseria sp. HMSC06F02]|nr:hypothetical protein HMPREF3156_00321 [Neisseria sp. HMSC06F02]
MPDIFSRVLLKFFLYKIQKAKLFIHRMVFCFSDDLVFLF